MSEPRFDLDELERLEREATPGQWHWKHNDIVQRDEAGKFVADVAGMYRDDDGYPSWGADNAANTELIVALRNAAPALFAELRTLRARVAELERDARLGQAVREAAEQAGDITDVEVLSDGDLCRGGYLGTIVVTEYQFDVLRAIDSALREEEGEEAPND